MRSDMSLYKCVGASVVQCFHEVGISSKNISSAEYKCVSTSSTQNFSRNSDKAFFPPPALLFKPEMTKRQFPCTELRLESPCRLLYSSVPVWSKCAATRSIKCCTLLFQSKHSTSKFPLPVSMSISETTISVSGWSVSGSKFNCGFHQYSQLWYLWVNKCPVVSVNSVSQDHEKQTELRQRCDS